LIAAAVAEALLCKGVMSSLDSTSGANSSPSFLPSAGFFSTSTSMESSFIFLFNFFMDCDGWLRIMNNDDDDDDDDDVNICRLRRLEKIISYFIPSATFFILNTICVTGRGAHAHSFQRYCTNIVIVVEISYVHYFLPFISVDLCCSIWFCESKHKHAGNSNGAPL
jgi:hypothetical protein